MATEYLMIDEITDILRSAPHGARIQIDGSNKYNVYHSATYEDGLIAHDTKYINPETGYTAPQKRVVIEVYDSIKDGHTVKIDGINILEL